MIADVLRSENMLMMSRLECNITLIFLARAPPWKSLKEFTIPSPKRPCRNLEMSVCESLSRAPPLYSGIMHGSSAGVLG